MGEFDGGDASARVGYRFVGFGAGNGVGVGAGEDACGVGLSIQVKRGASGERLDARPVGACCGCWDRRLLGNGRRRSVGFVDG